MSSWWKNRKVGAAALVVLIGAGIHFASAQTSGPANTSKTTSVASEEARLRKFLDKNGGYRDEFGGYYDSTTNTYTDEKGGILDNWEGYTYKDGSYKSKLGDYWDAPTATFKLANREVVPSKGTSSADAIHVLRGAVEEAGKFDKNFIRKAMLGQIGKEHPLPPPAQVVTQADYARLATYFDNNGGYKDNEGGYYNPKTGTYTDKEGGIVDNWQGYTYTDGSYKAATGDYWDAPTKTFKLANGEIMKSADTSNKDAINVLRQTAEENGKYYKDGIKTAMLARIKMEHPNAPAKP